MTDANSLAAEILESSAAGYAAAANAELQQAQSGDSGGAATSSEWKAHLTQRILELAAAVRVNEPSLFAQRVTWLRRAFKARGVAESQLRAVLESIRTALNRELPDALKTAIEQPLQLAFTALDTDVAPDVPTLSAQTPAGALVLRYLSACLDARTDVAVNLVLDALDGELTPQEAYTRVLLPAQKEIGELWHVGDVSVSEERLVSETTRQTMTLIAHRFSPPADEARTVLAASVAGNAHDIGLRGVADLFRLAGWRTIFLGADMPTTEIADAAQTFHSKLVVLSATLTTQLATLGAVVKRIRQADNEIKILVGGLAFEGTPGLWEQIGADAYSADIASVVTVGAQLIGSR